MDALPGPGPGPAALEQQRAHDVAGRVQGDPVHARVHLSASGAGAEVVRLPDPERPDLLARIRITGRVRAEPYAVQLAAAISRRRTDRRPFGDRRVTAETLARLTGMVRAEGADLHQVPEERVGELAVAVDHAADMQYFNPDFRNELTCWTHRPEWTRDGIPPTTAIAASHRPVPVRNLLPSGSTGMLVGAGEDEGATFTILSCDADRPLDLLRAGEAMSALLLTAAAEGVSTAPISEAVEVAWPRQMLRRMLPTGGEPCLIVRMGYVDTGEPPPLSPRREPRETIRIDL